MLRRYKKLLMALAGGLLAAGATAAHADIVVTLPNSTPIQAPGYFAGYEQFVYQIGLTNQTTLHAGSSFTIDDVNGLFNATAPAGWTASISSVGSMPAGGFPTPGVMSLGDVTYTYNGPDTTTGLTMGGFDVNTDPGFGGTTAGQYAAAGFDLGTGSASSNSGSVPVPSTSVPLPPAACVFPLALVLAAFGYRKLRPAV